MLAASARKRLLVALPALLVAGSGCGSEPDDTRPCSVERLNGAAVITCPDGTTATIRDGADGAEGADGARGEVGETGAPGSSCTVVDNGGGSKTISCADGSRATVYDGRDGIDGISCSAEQANDGSRLIRCSDGSSVTLHDGRDGRDGDTCFSEPAEPGFSRVVCASDMERVSCRESSVRLRVLRRTTDGSSLRGVELAVDYDPGDDVPATQLDLVIRNSANAEPGDVRLGPALTAASKSLSVLADNGEVRLSSSGSSDTALGAGRVVSFPYVLDDVSDVTFWIVRSEAVLQPSEADVALQQQCYSEPLLIAPGPSVPTL